MEVRADSRLSPSQWETSLQSNAVSHWLGANLESAWKCFKEMVTYFSLNSSAMDKMADTSADNIFKCIFLNENVKILIQIWLKLVPRGSNDNKSALVR